MTSTSPQHLSGAEFAARVRVRAASIRLSAQHAKSPAFRWKPRLIPNPDYDPPTLLAELQSELRRMSDDFGDEVTDVSGFNATVAASLKLPGPPPHAEVTITEQFDWFEPFVDI